MLTRCDAGNLRTYAGMQMQLNATSIKKTEHEPKEGAVCNVITREDPFILGLTYA
jgi:hypothetical protein